jgi:ribulose-phosphate 3-epimerase
MTEIVPSILTNDVSDFRKKHADLLAISHLFSSLHIDFADGMFVDSKTILPKDIMFFKSPFKLTAHLMTLHPEQYFSDLKKLGFLGVLFHVEIFENNDQVREVMDHAWRLELKPGLVLNPETPVERVLTFLVQAGMIQIMSINPGGQGREFIPQSLDKIKIIREQGRGTIIIVDGGIRVGVAQQCARAGASMLVVGSGLTVSEDMSMALEILQADVAI